MIRHPKNDPDSGGVWIETDLWELGWLRWIPHGGFFIHVGVTHLWRYDIAWDLNDSFPDEIFGDILSVSSPDDPVAEGSRDDEPQDPAEVEFAQAREKDLRRAEHAAGVPPVITVRDTFELMRGLGLIERVEERESTYWRPVDPLPLPEEVISMTPAEVDELVQERWHVLHERLAQHVIRLFVDEDSDVLSTSIRDLAQRLEMPPEDVREALLSLLHDGDFGSSSDIERVGTDDGFSLEIDWDRFRETRIGVRLDAEDLPEPP